MTYNHVKIASPRDLVSELRQLLTYTTSPTPSRAKLAHALRSLANRVSSDIEYVVWGIPPGETEEDVLYTKARSMVEAKKIIRILEKEHGCKKCRVQVLDLTVRPDFSKIFNK